MDMKILRGRDPGRIWTLSLPPAVLVSKARVGRGAAGAWRAGLLGKGPSREPAPLLARLLSPALSSTFCGGEGEHHRVGIGSGKDDVKMRLRWFYVSFYIDTPAAGEKTLGRVAGQLNFDAVV
jgi:hypothetical protein